MAIFPRDDRGAYLAWRDAKLSSAPAGVGDLAVEVGDIAALTDAEHGALLERIRRCNMVVYVERRPQPGRDDKAALRALGRRFGLDSLDGNALADDDGITPLAVHRDGTRARYIPYTDRPIAWHTDGYYNPDARRVRALTLHCARPAAAGGANRLMDAEMLYILLHEQDPALVEALAAPDAMTIPGNDEEGLARPPTVGPVYYVDRDGRLGMRYTARARNVEWSPAARPAAEAIRRILDGPCPHVFEARLEAGQGLVSNNVLHTRERFQEDPAAPRLLYRARYHDRIATT